MKIDYLLPPLKKDNQAHQHHQHGNYTQEKEEMKERIVIKEFEQKGEIGVGQREGSPNNNKYKSLSPVRSYMPKRFSLDDTKSTSSRPLWINDLYKVLSLWRKRLKGLETKVATIENQVKQLQAKDKELEREIEKLKQKDRELDAKDAALENMVEDRVEQLRSSITQLKRDMEAQLESKARSLGSRISQVQSHAQTAVLKLYRRSFYCEHGFMNALYGEIYFRYPFITTPTAKFFYVGNDNLVIEPISSSLHISSSHISWDYRGGSYCVIYFSACGYIDRDDEYPNKKDI